MSTILTGKDNPSDTITLRNPELEDTFELNENLISRITLGGLPIGYKDSSWFNNIILVYNFTVEKETTIDLLKTFLTNTNGLVIKMVNYLNEIRYGYIIDPKIEIITIKDTRSYSFDFTFLSLYMDGTVPTYDTAISSIKYNILTEGSDNLVAEDSNNLVGEDYVDVS